MNTETQVLQRVESEQAQSELPVIVPVEPKTSQQARIDEVNEALLPAYQKASELRLSDEENQALLVPFADDQVEIRPHDGLLYIPHIHISDRLIRVLGAGQWAMVRRREWIEANRIYAEYVMKVRGCFVGESVGAMDYHPSNPRMNYSDALEGTRGECIRRIAAKDLGCGSQVWNPEYCRQWVARYAEKDRKGQWQRKGQGNGHNQLSQTTQRQQPAAPAGNVPQRRVEQSAAPPAQVTEEQRLRWIAELKRRGEYALGYNPPQFDENGDEIETVTGKLDFVSENSGSSKKGPWTRYGLKVGDEWFGTFSKPLGEAAKKDKGHTVKICFKRGDQWNDLVSIERAR